MKERPILFNGDMVNAILSGSKTQTRRAISDKLLTVFDAAAQCGEMHYIEACDSIPENSLGYVLDFCPYGKVGDQLWVRERWATHELSNHIKPSELSENTRIYCYQNFDQVCDDERSIDGIAPVVTKWRPSIFMCRWMSRIQLEITDIRVERLNDISEDDAKAEGISMSAYETHCWQNYLMPNRAIWALCTPEKSFKSLWESISGKGSWDLNPWVWVVEFKQIERV